MHGLDVAQRHCVYCCRPEREVGELSHRGICNGCGKRRIGEAMDQISKGEGPIAEARIDGYVHFSRREVVRMRAGKTA